MGVTGSWIFPKIAEYNDPDLNELFQEVIV